MSKPDETLERARATNGEEPDVLSSLQGLKVAQYELRQGRDQGYYIKEAARYARGLPPEIVKRITHIDIPTLLAGSQEEVILKQLASDEAYEQIIRAANVYRAERGYSPLGPDGWPEKEARDGEAT